MLIVLFDIKYYKTNRINAICMQVIAHFVTIPPHFDRILLSCLFLITICSLCFSIFLYLVYKFGSY